MTILPSLDAGTVLYIDDEPQACKWFEKTFAPQFSIQTASCAAHASAYLSDKIAVVVCDHRMPGVTGLTFLTQLSHTHPNIIRILTSAYTDKTLLVEAISQSGVAYFIEKPWDTQHVIKILGQALQDYKKQALNQHAVKNGLLSAKSTLGFLAHELNTPLATINGYLDMLIHGLNSKLNLPSPKELDLVNKRDTFVSRDAIDVIDAVDDNDTVDEWSNHAGQSFSASQALATVKNQVVYVRNMLNASVQVARMAMLEQELPTVMASELVQNVIERFVLVSKIKPLVLIENDFLLKQSNDLIHLALCSVIQNALKAVTNVLNPKITIVLGAIDISKQTPKMYGNTVQFIQISDNGPGILLSILENLNARKPNSSNHGAGMGLLFCKRVIESLSGEFKVHSRLEPTSKLTPNIGTEVTFLFNAN